MSPPTGGDLQQRESDGQVRRDPFEDMVCTAAMSLSQTYSWPAQR